MQTTRTGNKRNGIVLGVAQNLVRNAVAVSPLEAPANY